MTAWKVVGGVIGGVLGTIPGAYLALGSMVNLVTGPSAMYLPGGIEVTPWLIALVFVVGVPADMWIGSRIVALAVRTSGGAGC